MNNYTPLYQKLFSKQRNDYKLVFEVGLGTNNLDIPSNMGLNGEPGASLYMWQVFSNAEIFGADVDKRIFLMKKVELKHILSISIYLKYKKNDDINRKKLRYNNR